MMNIRLILITSISLILSGVSVAENNPYGTLMESKPPVFNACPGVAAGDCNVVAPAGSAPASDVMSQ